MNNKLIVHGTEISVTTIDDKDYISLTDMLRAKDGDFCHLRLAAKPKHS